MAHDAHNPYGDPLDAHHPDTRPITPEMRARARVRQRTLGIIALAIAIVFVIGACAVWVKIGGDLTALVGSRRRLPAWLGLTVMLSLSGLLTWFGIWLLRDSHALGLPDEYANSDLRNENGTRRSSSAPPN